MTTKQISSGGERPSQTNRNPVSGKQEKSILKRSPTNNPYTKQTTYTN